MLSLFTVAAGGPRFDSVANRPEVQLRGSALPAPRARPVKSPRRKDANAINAKRRQDARALPPDQAVHQPRAREGVRTILNVDVSSIMFCSIAGGRVLYMVAAWWLVCGYLLVPLYCTKSPYPRQVRICSSVSRAASEAMGDVVTES